MRHLKCPSSCYPSVEDIEIITVPLSQFFGCCPSNINLYEDRCPGTLVYRRNETGNGRCSSDGKFWSPEEAEAWSLLEKSIEF